MRLWSIHPKYLDQKGLCGLWREALLAQRVLLQGEYKKCDYCSKGYKWNGLSLVKCPKCKGKYKIKTPYYNHSQLIRWKQLGDWTTQVFYIGLYLLYIYDEGIERGYNFDKTKIRINDFRTPSPYFDNLKLTVTKGQLGYEFDHLQTKLFKRDNYKFHINEQNTFIKDKKFWQRNLYKGELKLHKIESHPLFKIIDGDIESWEKVSK